MNMKLAIPEGTYIPISDIHPGVTVLSRRAEDEMIERFRADAKQAALRRADAEAARIKKLVEKKAAKALKPAKPAKPEPILTDEELRKKALKAAQRREDAEFFKERAQDRAANISGRLKDGYRRVGEARLSDYLLPFETREEGLRSETLGSKAAELWPSLVRRGGELRGRWSSRGALEVFTEKLFGLDMPYIEGNREFLTFMRIDTDLEWPSVAAARYAFEQLVIDGKIACAPHFLVGLVTRDGRFIRPHAIWCLPYGEGVWNNPKGKNWSKKPLDLFRDTYYGMVEAMIDVGADPEAPWATQQVKNPLCPEWHTECVQDNAFPDLKVLSESVNLNASRDKVTRKAAAFQAEHSITASNQLFNTYRRAALHCMQVWHFSGDPAYAAAMKTAGRGAVVDKVFEHLQTIDVSGMVSKTWKPKHLAALMDKVASYAADNWDPTKAKAKRKNAGTLMGEINASASLSERQALGGRYAATQKADHALRLILEALRAMQGDGEAITKKAVARRSGCALMTVRRRWAEIEGLIGPDDGGNNQSKGKKQPAITTVQNKKRSHGTALNTGHPSETNLTKGQKPVLDLDTLIRGNNQSKGKKQPYLTVIPTQPSATDTSLSVESEYVHPSIVMEPDWWQKRLEERDSEDEDAEIGIGYSAMHYSPETEDSDTWNHTDHYDIEIEGDY